MREGMGKKVLIVEDKRDALRLLTKVLMARGYEVVGVRSGMEAIRCAEKELPDFILMDIRLPGEIDGLEAARRIKAMLHLAHIPIVAISASVREQDKQQALAAGCDGFIPKPIDIEELPRQVARFLADR